MTIWWFAPPIWFVLYGLMKGVARDVRRGMESNNPDRRYTIFTEASVWVCSVTGLGILFLFLIYTMGRIRPGWCLKMPPELKRPRTVRAI